jgi:hypothetical protein
MTQVRFKLKDIESNAKYRPHGYVDDVLASGQIDGEYLLLTESAATALVDKYREPSPIAGLKNDPTAWGPVLWEVLHNRTAKNILEQDEEKRWLGIFLRWIPCGKCKKHFISIVRATPPDISSQSAYEQWAIDVHNQVNLSLGKPVYRKQPDA